MGKLRLKPRPVTTGTFKANDLMRRGLNYVLNSGQISYGEISQYFEMRFASLHECQYGILSNSGTSSLQVALQAMKEEYRWPDGSRVIVPATTFVATSNVVIHNRLLPVFVDVDPNTCNIDANCVRREMSRDVVCVIPVHLLGQPSNMTALREAIGNYKDVKILEDSCETMFATHNGKSVGSLGDIGCFSFYVAHLIVTGVGGMATTNNSTLAGRMRSLVNHGLCLEYLNPGANFAPRPMPGRRFRFDSVGHSYRITELESALGAAQLVDHQQMINLRRRNGKHLMAGISRLNRDYDGVFHEYLVEPENTSSFMMFPLILRQRGGECVSKEPLMAWLNDRQIETRDLLPIIGQPIYRWVNPKHYPVSAWLVESGFYIGCHQDLNPEDIDYVLQCIEEYLEKLHHG